MNISVLFFGVLSEIAGTGFKVYRDINSLENLKIRIGDDYPEFIHYSYRISVNNEITDNDMVLKDGDEIALLPPFAGG